MSAELTSEDRAAFVPPSSKAAADEYVTELTLRIDSISFREGLKWRLYHGDSPYSVTIADEGFLERVRQRQDLFGQGDHLHVRLRTLEWSEDGTAKHEHIVDRVIDHIPATDVEQTQLDAPDDE